MRPQVGLEVMRRLIAMTTEPSSEIPTRSTQVSVRRYTTPFYNLFPNAVLVFHPLWLSQMSLMPEGVDQVRVVHRMLLAEPPSDDAERVRLEKSFAHIHGEVFEKEDLAICESIQSTLNSGANSNVLLGGLEEGMRLFHVDRDRALQA
jgi:Rieske 2Fe-2S family protein